MPLKLIKANTFACHFKNPGMEDSFDVWEKRKKTIIQMPCEPCPVTKIPWGSNCAVGQTFVVLLDMQYHFTF